MINDVLPIDQRACYGMDPDLFTGYDGESTADRIFREADAKSVCGGCELMTACLDWAMDHDERGVWGGTSDDDRRTLRTGRKPRSHAAQDPEGLTTQQRARKNRFKIAKNLRARGIDYKQISEEIGVSIGTVYDYFRYEGKYDHVQASSGAETEAETTSSEGPGSPDSGRSGAPVLKATGS
jgi:hypothetical protein